MHQYHFIWYIHPKLLVCGQYHKAFLKSLKYSSSNISFGDFGFALAGPHASQAGWRDIHTFCEISQVDII